MNWINTKNPTKHVGLWDSASSKLEAPGFWGYGGRFDGEEGPSLFSGGGEVVG